MIVLGRVDQSESLAPKPALDLCHLTGRWREPGSELIWCQVMTIRSAPGVGHGACQCFRAAGIVPPQINSESQLVTPVSRAAIIFGVAQLGLLFLSVDRADGAARATMVNASEESNKDNAKSFFIIV